VCGYKSNARNTGYYTHFPLNLDAGALDFDLKINFSAFSPTNLLKFQAQKWRSTESPFSFSFRVSIIRASFPTDAVPR
jgi:hypothetical protein